MAPVWVLLSFYFSAAEGQKIITAESGQDVTLTCRAKNNNINLVEWTRADLEPENVFVYRGGNSVPDQHPSFKNRVDLQDRQMKDGDVSLILKNVTTNDTGTYECRVRTEKNGPPELICIIYLRVAPPGPTGGTTEGRGKEDGGKEDGVKEDGGKEDGGKKDRGNEDGEKEDGGKEDGGKEDGSVGMIVGLSVSAVLLVVVVAVVVFLIYRKCKQDQGSYQPPAELQPV